METVSTRVEDSVNIFQAWKQIFVILFYSTLILWGMILNRMFYQEHCQSISTSQYKNFWIVSKVYKLSQLQGGAGAEAGQQGLRYSRGWCGLPGAAALPGPVTCISLIRLPHIKIDQQLFFCITINIKSCHDCIYHGHLPHSTSIPSYIGDTNIRSDLCHSL